MSNYYRRVGRNVERVSMQDWVLQHAEDVRMSKLFGQSLDWGGSHGNLLVSTVFLGIDHRFGREGKPLLYETMVFGLPWDEEVQWRCSTYEEAMAQHTYLWLSCLTFIGVWRNREDVTDEDFERWFLQW